MQTSSPISDAVSYTPPDVGEIDEIDKKEENQFASLGFDGKWPEVIKYLRERQEFYRKYLPDGTAIVNLSSEEAGQWWKSAATIIAELDAFINIVEVSKDAVRESRRG
jgi:hypothetical protein